ncbi:MAG: hypothetical protein OXL68_16740 [Paracoccaceae bacterium]|nr:hypothetical protein [Paracoccaceae bacterium]
MTITPAGPLAVWTLLRKAIAEGTVPHRQEYLVCLVAELLAPEWVSPWTMGHDWAPWDLEHGSGARIQIKQSAARDP